CGQRTGSGHGQASAAGLWREPGRRGRRSCDGDRACAFGQSPSKDHGGACMIGKLSGLVDAVAEDHVIVDVGGVGYLVHCPSSTLSRLAVGASVSLMVETRVSEDAIRLY